MGIEKAYDKAKAKVNHQSRWNDRNYAPSTDLDEREQAVYTHLEFEPKPGARVAAARVIVAAQEYLEDNADGTISLHAARLAALRFAILQFEQTIEGRTHT